jgi:hypothetical protein
MCVTTENTKPDTYFIMYVYMMNTHVFFGFQHTETIKGKIMIWG